MKFLTRRIGDVGLRAALIGLSSAITGCIILLLIGNFIPTLFTVLLTVSLCAQLVMIAELSRRLTSRTNKPHSMKNGLLDETEEMMGGAMMGAIMGKGFVKKLMDKVKRSNEYSPTIPIEDLEVTKFSSDAADAMSHERSLTIENLKATQKAMEQAQQAQQILDMYAGARAAGKSTLAANLAANLNWDGLTINTDKAMGAEPKTTLEQAIEDEVGRLR